MIKTEIVSFRTTRQERVRLGALARRAFKEAGMPVSAKAKRDNVSLFLGCVTAAVLAGKIHFNPKILKRAA